MKTLFVPYRWLLLSNMGRGWPVFAGADLALTGGAVALAFLLRFDGRIPAEHVSHMVLFAAGASATVVGIFLLLHVYRFHWVFVGVKEVFQVWKGVTGSFSAIGLAVFIFRDPPFSVSVLEGFPRSVIFISYILSFFFLGGFRLAKRLLHEFSLGGISPRGRRALVVGAGEAGEQMARSIMGAAPRTYDLIGFVDDNVSKIGSFIHGVKVLGVIEDIPRLVERFDIEEMIIALPSVGSDAIRRAVENGRRAGLASINIVPPLLEILTGEASLGSLREVRVEDLLGREPVALDTKAIQSFLKEKAVLITGAAGSIGSELSRLAAKFGPRELVLVDQDESGIFTISRELQQKFPEGMLHAVVGDVKDENKMRAVFQSFAPQVVFHAAAYKHVPLMEEHPEEAAKNNIFGTWIVALESINAGAESFIFVSTDKAVNPVSVMGATKRAGEMICRVLNQRNVTRFISVRFGNVLDSRGSVIPIFREQIAKRGAVTVTHPDMKRYFMSASEACLLVMHAGAMGRGGEVFVLDMGKPISIVDLAREMIKLSGFEPDRDIPIVFTGARPGEKFFEDILSAEEGIVATQHRKIFLAKPAPFSEAELLPWLENLKRVASAGDKENVRRLLRLMASSRRTRL